MAQKFIKDAQLSDLLGIPLSTIRADRYKDRRIPFIRLGKSILYDPDECIQTLKSFQVGGVTTEARGKGGRHG